jgi:hypothetical protein
VLALEMSPKGVDRFGEICHWPLGQWPLHTIFMTTRDGSFLYNKKEKREEKNHSIQCLHNYLRTQPSNITSSSLPLLSKNKLLNTQSANLNGEN